MSYAICSSLMTAARHRVRANKVVPLKLVHSMDQPATRATDVQLDAVTPTARRSARVSACSTGQRASAASWHTELVRSSVAEDTLAIGLFRHADDTGQPITLGLAETWLSGLLSHDAGCGCGSCE